MKKENIFFIITIFLFLSPAHAGAKSEILLGLSVGAGTAAASNALIYPVNDAMVFSVGLSALFQSLWVGAQLPKMYRLRRDADEQTRVIKAYLSGLSINTIINGAIVGSLTPVAYKAHFDPDSLTAADYFPVALALGVKGAHSLAGYVIKHIQDDLLAESA